MSLLWQLETKMQTQSCVLIQDMFRWTLKTVVILKNWMLLKRPRGSNPAAILTLLNRMWRGGYHSDTQRPGKTRIRVKTFSTRGLTLPLNSAIEKLFDFFAITSKRKVCDTTENLLSFPKKSFLASPTCRMSSLICYFNFFFKPHMCCCVIWWGFVFSRSPQQTGSRNRSVETGLWSASTHVCSLFVRRPTW